MKSRSCKLEVAEMRSIQFESIVEGGVIRIPAQYMGILPDTVKVTLVPAENTRPEFKPKAKAGALFPDDFTPMIDTRDWKFDREEANERR
jgi:hypothetical protein